MLWDGLLTSRGSFSVLALCVHLGQRCDVIPGSLASRETPEVCDAPCRGYTRLQHIRARCAAGSASGCR